MAPRGRFNRHQEGHRFLTPLASSARSPRNLREEWEYETDEFQEFAQNVKNIDVIQDPAVCSVDAYVTKYPEHNGTFAPEVEWVLLAGERRYRAELERKAPEDSIPVVLRDGLLDKGDFVLLSENNFRKGWDPIQEAQLLNRIRSEEGLSYDEILEKLSGVQAAIKRRSDISKRLRLLDLADGPLRRAIRQRDIGLEPAYTLVSRLKTQALIEQGWALMQEKGLKAVAACDVLLGKIPESTPHTASTTSDDDPGLPETDHESAPVAPSDAPSAEEDRSDAEKSEHDRNPADLQKPSGFADETPHSSGRVPAQQTPRAEVAPAAEQGTERVDDDVADAETEEADDAAGRLDACAHILASRSWPTPDESTRTVAVHVILEATRASFELALKLAGSRAEPASVDRNEFVAALDSAHDSGALMLAYAVALATDELHLRKLKGRMDARAANYLQRLQGSTAYDITENQPALAAVSPTKL